jgi:hypothetical protein
MEFNKTFLKVCTLILLFYFNVILPSDIPLSVYDYNIVRQHCWKTFYVDMKMINISVPLLWISFPRLLIC